MIQHYNCICLQFDVVSPTQDRLNKKVLKLLLSSAETERNLARNSLGLLENLGAQARSLKPLLTAQSLL